MPENVPRRVRTALGELLGGLLRRTPQGTLRLQVLSFELADQAVGLLVHRGEFSIRL
jgi:hypothetical protein